MSSILDLNIGGLFAIGVNNGPQLVASQEKHPHFGVLVFQASDAVVDAAAASLFAKFEKGDSVDCEREGKTTLAQIIQSMLCRNCARVAIGGYLDWRVFIVVGEKETEKLLNTMGQLGFEALPAEFVD